MWGARKLWLVVVAALALAVRAPETVPLSGATGFDWDRVQVFAYGTDSADLSDAGGGPVEWSVSATSYEGPALGGAARTAKRCAPCNSA